MKEVRNATLEGGVKRYWTPKDSNFGNTTDRRERGSKLKIHKKVRGLKVLKQYREC